MNAHAGRGGVGVGAVEGFLEGAGREELGRVASALRRRARELGLSAAEISGAGSPTTSAVLRRIPHEYGELTLETRASVRKDGTASRRGPYWYFRWRSAGGQRVLYLGKTERPEEVLRDKRAGIGSGLDPRDDRL